MPDLICLRGLPGSGKSTIAKSVYSRCVRLNRDDLRASLFNRTGVLPYADEQMVTKIQRSMAEIALKEGRDVIVDDTHLRQKYLREWNEFAIRLGATFSVQDVTTSVDVCVARDSARERSVGEDVIRSLAAKFTRDGEFPPHAPVHNPEILEDKVVWDSELPHCIIVDIDGTMALMGDRSPYDWARVGEDKPNRAVVNLVNRLLRDGYHVLFMSGRDSVCSWETLDWLDKHIDSVCNSQWDLIMRTEGDQRRDDIVKRELFDKHVRGQWHVKFVLDDRDQVVDMWRRIGLSCFQVAPGAF